MPRKSLNVKNYQFYETQSYYIEGLLRIDILNEVKGNISFYINDALNIHRTKLDNSDNYYSKNKKYIKYKVDLNNKLELDLKEDKMLFIKGLGIIKLSKDAKYLIHHYNKVNLYLSEVLF